MGYLVGYSADKGGAEALLLASLLARSSSSGIDAVTVLPETWDHPSPAKVDVEYAEFLDRHAEKALATARKSVPEDIPAQFHARHADSTGEGLTKAAQELGAQMIVLGSSRKAPMSRFQEGVVASELLRSAPLPVALAPRGYAPEGQRITRVTCAVSASDASIPLAHRACDLARSLNASLRLASFVVRDRQMYPSIAGYDAEHMISNRIRSEAEALYGRIRKEWQGELPFETVIGDGPNWRQAVNSIDWDPQEVLLIGSSRLGALMRVFVGSNSGKILRHAPVPRIILPRLAEKG
ncbi:universal stress protein [Paracoccus caeni]|uniref:Universal stress protein n=1 Tax=Paracoccus caeni TaxID=657651 RepID=A0A934W1R9_9RHOB|nr:universal stress protein [Paracoccus caeni]MBK4217653.1 universal stress protein [Paracoccus caeni]